MRADNKSVPDMFVDHSIEVRPGLKLATAALFDAEALALLVSSNLTHLQVYLPAVAGLASVESAQGHLEYARESARQGDLLEWHIFSDDVLCGAVRLNHIEQANRKASIAYYIGASYQNKGLVTASVRAVLAYCFEHLGFNRIELKCAASNAASQHVAERLGFVQEGLLRQAELLNGEFVDHYVYGLLREQFDWQSACVS